ncbi:subunit RPC10 of DNA-directed RNA polymerase III [Chloropicon roscoffensis]|uniref:DNA-directed RNA polymerase subunit n=1 Tax=Chloropicon roscoffensis TaxID=1461544 RepID=A0AAX4P0M3_9CHLO|mmetsp:Transcript_10570/g.32351  ORF Transcript_10570/g.32351 Transcript_10570/m.32351 type:complete len:111 (-) Transcript_10570:124-456(-)|eukprot:CAMPEP_0198463436 /NCGR_PEP_ID=MMETSP1456-20131121/1770_1 /TAXON_ID=1461544 ORGANISM="Unidentified sp., Strain RCC1871" /NCGR_SAMPLE_ID=MMETSP1456 /ASSEMBLY_ACC=CAM_ASM_001119 /LENGTH=110 /DNA_ID=CAMNT_0044188897 /DNA_START=106 /DNA_END=438 /DNA_ORIENTATION=+
MLQLFCPTCGTFLYFKQNYTWEDSAEFYCKLCPYKYAVNETVSDEVPLKKKRDDLVLSKENMQKGDKAEVVCPKCSHGHAYFMQMQTRSADEASTIIYECCNCGHKWRED